MNAPNSRTWWTEMTRPTNEPVTGSGGGRGFDLTSAAACSVPRPYPLTPTLSLRARGLDRSTAAFNRPTVAAHVGGNVRQRRSDLAR